MSDPVIYFAVDPTDALSANTDKNRGKGVRTNAQVSVDDARSDPGCNDRPLRLRGEEARVAASAGGHPCGQRSSGRSQSVCGSGRRIRVLVSRAWSFLGKGRRGFPGALSISG